MPRPWLAAAILLLALAGCGKGGFSHRASAGKERILRCALTANPTHVDPALVQDTDTIDLTQQVFEGLVTWSTENKVVANLADSWTISPDGRTYTFKLRPGVTFSNGRPLIAADFKSSVERACNPDLRSQTAEEYLGDVVGVSDCVHGRTKDVRGITVVDDHTLTIELTAPVAYFLDKLTYPCAFVVCREALPPVVKGVSGEMVEPRQMVGTGPFIAKRYVEDQVFEFAANRGYHGGAPQIDGIERPILKDATSRLNKYKSDELDMLALARQDIPAMMKDPVYAGQLHVQPRPQTYYIAFNLSALPVFKNRDVRRAFAMAVNNREICEKTLGGLEARANGIIPDKVLGHRASTQELPFDPAEAKRLLALAGYPDPAKFPPVDFYVRADQEDTRLVAEAVQSQLAKNLGVEVTLKPLEWTTLLDKRNRQQLPLYHLNWVADYLDPQNFISLLFTTTCKGNHQSYSNPEVDSICAEADLMRQTDPKRLELYAKAEDLILQDAAWIPLYFAIDHELVSPRVHGLRESVFGHLPHTTVTLDNQRP